MYMYTCAYLHLFFVFYHCQVRESWMTYELDLINYQNKCRLIRGWDDLFNKVKEHINSVAAMKLSPYFKVFEDDAMAWEDRLNRINALFDVWIDVQRRWVYLEGIFTGSADIKHLLPNESQRFQRFVNVSYIGLDMVFRENSCMRVSKHICILNFDVLAHLPYIVYDVCMHVHVYVHT